MFGKINQNEAKWQMLNDFGKVINLNYFPIIQNHLLKEIFADTLKQVLIDLIIFYFIFFFGIKVLFNFHLKLCDQSLNIFSDLFWFFFFEELWTKDLIYYSIHGNNTIFRKTVYKKICYYAVVLFDNYFQQFPLFKNSNFCNPTIFFKT